MDQSNKNYTFFLGGKDAEMERIAEILEEHKYPYYDAGLGWGAKVSHYQNEIELAVLKGLTPVLIELESDLPIESFINIDHHNKRSAEPASILQVLNLIHIPPSRLDLLIAANDAGYIPGMQKIEATPQEISMIRLKDRMAQGISTEQEDQAYHAIKNMEQFGPMIVVKMPHSKSSTITDRLFGTQERENILILSEDGEVNYFGHGDVCQTLSNKFPDSWAGGEGLGDSNSSAFYGGYPPHEDILNFLKEKFLPLPNNTADHASLPKPSMK